MKLSQIVWQEIHPVYQAILKHSFIQELIQGTLSAEIFNDYIAQDVLYLQDYARVLAAIAARASDTTSVQAFLKFAQQALVGEQELVHQFFVTPNTQSVCKPTMATLAYTSYLLNVSCLESYEVAVAAVLPCFWVYREVGVYAAMHKVANNRYNRWIETYASAEFAVSVDEAIHIFDRLAETTTESIRQKMRSAFYKSTVLEWHFWQDAYTKRTFDQGFDDTSY